MYDTETGQKIELLFKLYKSHIKLDKLKGRPYKVLCELDCVQCSIFLVIPVLACWSQMQVENWAGMTALSCHPSTPLLSTK
ncbi:hypothetical protein GOM44_07495 [Wolbachia endosymbiont of Atemnus politus]|nr:hypothetical protein [Wolbachia endosymbiont of Atemnus politus]